MEVLITIAIDLVILAAGMRLGWCMHRDREAAARPYRWDCPEEGCIFHFESSDSIVTLQAADGHERGHTRD